MNDEYVLVAQTINATCSVLVSSYKTIGKKILV